jgi:hypothetical protein
MAELDVLRVGTVTQRLVAPRERWGWEFHEPLGVQPYPAPRPQWSEPSGPHLPTLDQTYAQARAAMGKRIAIVAGILVLGLCLMKYGFILDLIAVALALLWFVPMIASKQRADQLMAEHQRYRQHAWNEYGAADAQWQAGEAQWRRNEEQRVASADRWFPIAPSTAPSRIDVFGGTAEGRAAFLVTLGSGLLAMRAGMTVLDLSERDVAGPLEQLARIVEFPYQRVSLPVDLHSAGLLEGIPAEDVAELIAWALHTRRGPNEGRALLDLDADILKSVATRLDEDITIARLAAGLRIVQRISDGREPLLSAREQQRLSQYVDVIGTSERMLGQVQDLRSTLESLSGLAPATPPTASAGAWRPAGLTVFASEDHNNRRRDLLNRLVAQTVIYRLRNREKPGDVIAIAGADTLGLEALNQMHQAAQRAGVRLVFLIEHLSDEFEPYLGDAESASIFMRMQNTKEAARAAEHIGRGHSFKLAQITQTAGTSDAFTRSTNESFTQGSSRSRSHGAGGSSSSESTNESYTEGTGTSSTRGTNESTGRTESRVYEFTVEPTHFQGLDPRSYVLVEPVPGGGRRILAGTCDPGVLTLPGVSDVPLSEAARAEAPGPQATGPGEQETLPLSEVNIADPSGQHQAFADSLTRAGYLVHYERNDHSPMLSGWLVTGHRDGRPLHPHEIMNYR